MAAAALWGAAACQAEVPVYDYEIVDSFPHDPTAFTQGLFYLDGNLYESTGRRGASSIRKIALETGDVLLKRDVEPAFFGEGIVNWGDRIFALTWRAQTGFIYDLETFEKIAEFNYAGEGWGLTQNGRQLIMSDGTSELRLLDPETLSETGRINVTYNGKTVPNLNELEWVNGEIYANVWKTNLIARIDPTSGEVVGWIDLRGLADAAQTAPDDGNVLNGIAYDAENDRLFVTGKYWPKLFEIRLSKRPAKP